MIMMKFYDKIIEYLKSFQIDGEETHSLVIIGGFKETWKHTSRNLLNPVPALFKTSYKF